MNYKLIYDKIVERGKNRILIDECVESHHIIPKCLGGSDNPENLVDLKPEEHYVCHQLLVKIHPDNRKILYAATMMCVSKNKKIRNNKLYGWLKRKMYNQVKLSCQQCNTTFSIIKSRYLKEKTKFCSHKCYRLSVNNKTNYSTFNCKICSIEFTVPSSHLRDGITEKACSKQCGIKLKQMNARVDLICLNCNRKYNVQKNKKNSKFCSLECCNIYKSKDAWITFNCKHCNKQTTKLKSWFKKNGNPTYCSFKCFNDERLKNKINL